MLELLLAGYMRGGLNQPRCQEGAKEGAGCPGFKRRFQYEALLSGSMALSPKGSKYLQYKEYTWALKT